MNTKTFITSLLLPALAGCGGNVKDNHTQDRMDWRSAVKEQLPLLGHRNWILVVDKAFPAQNSPGIETINTDVGLIDVLKFTLQQIDSSTHVKPIIYCDKELGYITAAQVESIDAFRKELAGALGGNAAAGDPSRLGLREDRRGGEAIQDPRAQDQRDHPVFVCLHPARLQVLVGGERGGASGGHEVTRDRTPSGP